MCPSYRATREERYSTRGRARLLAEMLRGEIIQDGWRSEEVREALDLCLACKGCRRTARRIPTWRRTRPSSSITITSAAAAAAGLHHGPGQPMGGCIAGAAPGQPADAMRPGHAAEIRRRCGAPAHDPEVCPPQLSQMVPAAPDGTGRRRPSRPVILWADTFNNHSSRGRLPPPSKYWRRSVIPSPSRSSIYAAAALYDFGMLDTARAYLRKSSTCCRPTSALACRSSASNRPACRCSATSC